MAAAGKSCNQGITATRKQASASFSVKNTEGKSERDSQYPRGKRASPHRPPFLPAKAQPFVSPRRRGAPKLELETWLPLPYTGEPLPFSTGSGSGARRFPRAAGAGLLTPGVTLSRKAPAVFLPAWVLPLQPLPNLFSSRVGKPHRESKSRAPSGVKLLPKQAGREGAAEMIEIGLSRPLLPPSLRMGR